MMVNADFFISPAYCVPQMSTMRFLKLMTMQVSELVPSSDGLDGKSGANGMVNSGWCSAAGWESGRMKSWRANRACQAYWLMTDRKSTRLNSSHLGISYAV